MNFLYPYCTCERFIIPQQNCSPFGPGAFGLGTHRDLKSCLTEQRISPLGYRCIMAAACCLILAGFILPNTANGQTTGKDSTRQTTHRTIPRLGTPSLIADTLELQEIEVTATRIRQPLSYQPTHIEVIDSSRLALLRDQSVGQILSANSSLFIKNTGPGSMATASQRGLSSEQIQVLWEGIPINSVMLGQKDLALLPSSFFSSVQVSSGTPSTAFGGGSLSGALYLSSDWQNGTVVDLEQGMGSYGQRRTSFNSRYRAEDWQLSLRTSLNHADNDFQYYNRAYNQQEYRQHNRQEQQNLMASTRYKWENSQLESRIWISDSQNQIPGTILNTSSQARQENQAVRWLSSYQAQVGRAELKVTNYLERVELDYFDIQNNTRSFSTSRRWMGNASFSLPLIDPSTPIEANPDEKGSSELSAAPASSAGSLPLVDQLLIKGEFSGVLTGVTTNNYITRPSRRQFSAMMNPELILANRRLRIYPAIRLDTYNDFGSVWSPSLGANLVVLPGQLYLRGQLSRDFNPPTFNALYWGQGGNPDLEPERSNSVEGGLTYTPHFFGMESLRLTVYHNRVEEGIRWYPGSEGIYTPRNVEEITSRGIEGGLDQRFLLPGQFQLSLKQSVAYNRAIITRPRFEGDNAVGNQLRYVPHWKYHASLGLKKGMVTGLLQFRQVGRRYTTDTENLSHSLDPYGVIDATLRLQKFYRSFSLAIRGGVRNLLDTNYEVVQWYAMPGRNYIASVNITYRL